MNKEIPTHPGFYASRINSNTQVYDIHPINVPAQDLHWLFPAKISNRISLNLNQLNGLATTIIPPHCLSDITEVDLAAILNYSNQVNSQIGLPATTDLIVRSAATFASRAIASEPAVLVKNVLSPYRSYRLLSDSNSNQTLDSFAHYKNLLGNSNHFLIIHDDNYSLQKSAIHGAMLFTESDAELICATGTLHARGLGNPATGVPTILLNATDSRGLFHLSPKYISDSVVKGTINDPFSRCQIRTLNCPSDSLPLYIYKRITHIKNSLATAYNRASRLFGPQGVMEFRLYPPTPESEESQLHVLDVNTKF